MQNSVELAALLKKNGIEPAQISNYHDLPICDNVSSKLSCDRLKYTLGNPSNFGFANEKKLVSICRYLCICKVGGKDELCFKILEIAEAFDLSTLKRSNVYACNEDCYARQILSEIIKDVLERHVLNKQDLNLGETAVIEKMLDDETNGRALRRFCSMTRITDEPEKNNRIVCVKKRTINPYIKEIGKFYECGVLFNRELQKFLRLNFNRKISLG